jgi:hypothetical protein
MSCNGGTDNVLQKGSKWHCLGGACEFLHFNLNIINLFNVIEWIAHVSTWVVANGER